MCQMNIYLAYTLQKEQLYLTGESYGQDSFNAGGAKLAFYTRLMAQSTTTQLQCLILKTDLITSDLI